MSHHIPDPIYLPDNIPFAQARSMTVDIPIDTCSKTDVYVDALITVGLDIDHNLEMLTKAPITVVHVVADNSVTSRSIPRDDIIAIDKMKAEGAAEERKICLGWKINSRRWLVSLPDHKTKGWISQIDKRLKQKTVSEKDLASILGRLENVAQVLTVLWHFLSNIRHHSTTGAPYKTSRMATLTFKFPEFSTSKDIT